MGLLDQMNPVMCSKLSKPKPSPTMVLIMLFMKPQTFLIIRVGPSLEGRQQPYFISIMDKNNI